MTNENTIRVVMAEAERQTKRAANQVSDWLAGNCAGEVPRIQLALLVEVSRAAAGHLESTPAATSAARARTCYSCKHHDAPGSSSGDSPCWDCTAPGHPGVMPRWEAAATASQPALPRDDRPFDPGTLCLLFDYYGVTTWAGVVRSQAAEIEMLKAAALVAQSAQDASAAARIARITGSAA